MNYTNKYYLDCQSTIDTALTKVPFYRQWKSLDPGPDKHIDERYSAFPILTKIDIAAHFPYGFVSEEQDLDYALANGEINYVKTSGTTSDAITNIWNQQWWDESYQASWKLNSHLHRLLSSSSREAVLGSPISVGPYADEKEIPMEDRIQKNCLFLNEKKNPALFSDQHMDRIIHEIVFFKPDVLEVNPSFMNVVCRYINRKGLTPWKPGLITYTYENPSLLHLKEIKQAFPGVPLSSSYGTTETGYVFTECELGRLHQNQDYCRIDFQPLKPEHGGPLLGRILVTTFHNSWYTIIKFTVDDLVRLDKTQTCSCGRNTGMILESIQGRFHDCTLTTDGRLVTMKAVDESLCTVPGLSGYKLTQLAANIYKVILTIDDNTTTDTVLGVKSSLNKLYGQDARIDVQIVPYLEPEVNGKYRLVHSLVPMKIEDYLSDSSRSR